MKSLILFVGALALTSAFRTAPSPFDENGNLRPGAQCMTADEVDEHNAGGHSYTLGHYQCGSGTCINGQCVQIEPPQARIYEFPTPPQSEKVYQIVGQDKSTWGPPPPKAEKIYQIVGQDKSTWGPPPPQAENTFHIIGQDKSSRGPAPPRPEDTFQIIGQDKSSRGPAPPQAENIFRIIGQDKSSWGPAPPQAEGTFHIIGQDKSSRGPAPPQAENIFRIIGQDKSSWGPAPPQAERTVHIIGQDKSSRGPTYTLGHSNPEEIIHLAEDPTGPLQHEEPSKKAYSIVTKHLNIVEQPKIVAIPNQIKTIQKHQIISTRREEPSQSGINLITKTMTIVPEPQFEAIPLSSSDSQDDEQAQPLLFNFDESQQEPFDAGFYPPSVQYQTGKKPIKIISSGPITLQKPHRASSAHLQASNDDLSVQIVRGKPQVVTKEVHIERRPQITREFRIGSQDESTAERQKIQILPAFLERQPHVVTKDVHIERRPQITREFRIGGQPETEQLTREVVPKRTLELLQPQITKEVHIEQRPQITREFRFESQPDDQDESSALLQKVQILPAFLERQPQVVTKEVHIEQRPQITREFRIGSQPEVQITRESVPRQTVQWIQKPSDHSHVQTQVVREEVDPRFFMTNRRGPVERRTLELVQELPREYLREQPQVTREWAVRRNPGGDVSLSNLIAPTPNHEIVYLNQAQTSDDSSSQESGEGILPGPLFSSFQ